MNLLRTTFLFPVASGHYSIHSTASRLLRSGPNSRKRLSQTSKDSCGSTDGYMPDLLGSSQLSESCLSESGLFMTEIF